MKLCQDYLTKIKSLEENNLHYIRDKLGLAHEKFSKKIAKVDKDYFQAMGLGRRLELPKDVTIEDAKLLKLKIQERVMVLWTDNQSKVSKALDMDLLLQILECYAEDELYFSHHEIEIEHIERIIASEYDKEAT